MNRLCTTGRVLAFFLIVAPMSSCYYPASGDYRGTWEHGPGMMGWFGPFGMIIFLIVAIMVLAALFKWIGVSNRSSGNNKAGETSLDILKKRYAAGDITKEEFERIKRDIED